MPGAGGGARPPDFGPLTPLWRYRLTHSDHPSKMRPRIRGATEKNFTTISIGVEHRDNSSDFPAACFLNAAFSLIEGRAPRPKSFQAPAPRKCHAHLISTHHPVQW
jgi:hypothetical protein